MQGARAELTERSLGAPTSYNVVSSRYNLLTIARELGILVPDTAQISSRQELDDWGGRETLPWVVKSDGTWGGVGVRVVQSADKIDSSWRELTQIFSIYSGSETHGGQSRFIFISNMVEGN